MAKASDTINFRVGIDWLGIWTVFKVGLAVGVGLALPLGAMAYAVLTVTR